MSAVVLKATADLDILAHAYAAVDPVEADRLIAAHIAQAVRERAMDDAIRWQRVALRVRSLRRRGRGGAL